MPQGDMGPGTAGPVSVPVLIYNLGPSGTPERFASFPSLCNVEGSDALGQWTAFFLGFHILGFCAFYAGKSFCMLNHCYRLYLEGFIRA